jgi:hypothetical protein
MYRRDFLVSAALPLIQGRGPERAAPLLAGTPQLPDTFPMQAPAMVREMVIVSHGNAKRVRELVEAHPALARAAIDWGFGDWEDALGAASHVGNREIAEYLISRGARPTIFSATMLGQFEAVKAFVAANPGAQRIAGPHSISLLSHAKAGGAAAKAVYDYLDQLGDAGGPTPEPLSDEDKASLAGIYRFGSGPSDQIAITIDKGTVMFNRPGMPYPRGLYHVGDRAFFPMGAAAVRIRFERTALTIHDPDLILTATKTA